MKTYTIKSLSWEEALGIVQDELPSVIGQLLSKAHKQGARRRPARAEVTLKGQLLHAAHNLGDVFEEQVREMVPGNAWNVSFGYTAVNHAPGTILIQLK